MVDSEVGKSSIDAGFLGLGVLISDVCKRFESRLE